MTKIKNQLKIEIVNIDKCQKSIKKAIKKFQSGTFSTKNLTYVPNFPNRYYQTTKPQHVQRYQYGFLIFLPSLFPFSGSAYHQKLPFYTKKLPKVISILLKVDRKNFSFLWAECQHLNAPANFKSLSKCVFHQMKTFNARPAHSQKMRTNDRCDSSNRYLSHMHICVVEYYLMHTCRKYDLLSDSLILI